MYEYNYKNYTKITVLNTTYIYCPRAAKPLYWFLVVTFSLLVVAFRYISGHSVDASHWSGTTQKKPQEAPSK